MNYGEVKDHFIALLNRRDVTPSLVDNFIKLSIQRAQRLLRVPASEQIMTVDVGEDFDQLFIPGDYFKLVLIMVDDQELQRVSLTEAMRLARHQGCPQVFARASGSWIIGPAPSVGSQIQVVYLADFSSLVNTTDTNWLTEAAPDIVYYGALSAACKYFVDPRADAFEQDFVKAISDLNLQAADDELTNASIGPCFYYPGD